MVLCSDGERFHSFVRGYLQSELSRDPDFRPQWLLDSCGSNATVHDFSHRRCGHLFGFYNNFFVTSVAFWRSAPVRRLLDYIDRSGVIYARRYGDLLLQSIAVQIHMPRAEVHLFQGFTYEHSTRVSRQAYERQQGELLLRQQKQKMQKMHQRQLERRTPSRQQQRRERRQPLSRREQGKSLQQTEEDESARWPSAVADGASHNSPASVASNAECIAFGGIAAGEDDPHGYETVLDMVRTGAFCRAPCVRVFLARGRLVAAATAGQVKVEQHDCRRSPPPYYCLAGGSVVAEMAQALERPAPLHGQASLRYELKAHSQSRGEVARSRGRANRTIGSIGRGEKVATGGKDTWKERIALDADTMRSPDSAYALALVAWDRMTGVQSAKPRMSELTMRSISTWSHAANLAAPLGTCSLPPAVSRSKCGEAVKLIRSHPAAHNVLSGIRFACPSSIHRYLAACRPEAECRRAEAPNRWYNGEEELSCTQRAVLSVRTRAALWGNQSTDAVVSRLAIKGSTHQAWYRNGFMRHGCERLASLPAVGSLETSAGEG